MGDHEVVVVPGVEDAVDRRDLPVHRHRGQVPEEGYQGSAHRDAAETGELRSVIGPHHRADQRCDEIPCSKTYSTSFTAEGGDFAQRMPQCSVRTDGEIVTVLL